MTQQVINVGTAPNDGQGDPIRTSFIKCNSNFSELYSRVQTSPPATLVGSVGDEPGMYAFDADYFYYCFAAYDGSSIIWAQIAQVGNVTAEQLINGSSNVEIAYNGNITFGISGDNDVVVMSNSLVQINTDLLVPSSFETGTITALAVDALGNITGNYFLGNGSQLTGLPETYNNANVISLLENFGSNVISSSGNVDVGNISTTGKIISDTTLTATGNVTGGNVTTAGQVVATGNVTGGNVTTAGQVVATGNVTGGNLKTSAVTITSSTITASGNITGGNLVTSNSVVSGNIINAGTITSTGNITTTSNVVAQGQVVASGNIVTSGFFIGNFIGNVIANITVPGTTGQILFNTAGNADAVAGLTYDKSSNSFAVLGNVSAQSYLLSSSATITANLSAGNVITGGKVVATGNVSGSNLVANGYVTATGGIEATSTYTGPYSDGIVVDYSTGNGRISMGANDGLIIYNNGVANTAIVTISSNGDILGSGNITTTANINSGNLITTGLVSASSIEKTGSNAVGNIGSDSNYFGYVFAGFLNGTALSAQYADLAENYISDSNYEPGTVLSFGGNNEVTISQIDSDPTVAGVVSTKPGYLLNSTQLGEYVSTLALIGQVPCKVKGPICKGQMLVSAGDGFARAETKPNVGTVIGKALENFNGEVGVIKIAVGKL